MAQNDGQTTTCYECALVSFANLNVLTEPLMNILMYIKDISSSEIIGRELVLPAIKLISFQIDLILVQN